MQEKQRELDIKRGRVPRVQESSSDEEEDEGNEDEKEKREKSELLKFPVTDGVPRSQSAHARPSTRPPIDMSGNYPANVSPESPSNISPNHSEVTFAVSEPYDNF